MPTLKGDAIDTSGKSDIEFSDTALYPLTTTHKDFYKVTSRDTDASAGGEEFYFYPKWTTWYGYYMAHEDFSAVIDKLASWAVGSGYEAKPEVKKILDRIKGYGKDDFNSLLENFCKTFLMAGDSFGEILKDKAGRLINLKPINPGSMAIVTNGSSMVERYEQHSRNLKVETNVFTKEEIFHCAWNRIADSSHGMPFAEKVESILKAIKQAFLFTNVLMRRHVMPVQIFNLGTSDATEVARVKKKIDSAYQNTENVYTAAGVIEKVEQVGVPQYSSIDPLPYQKYLQRRFTTALGVPEVIMGWGEETTEASSNVIYVAFEQTIRRIQRFIEAQLKLQVGIEINLIPPPSLIPKISDDQAKDKKTGPAKPSDVDPTKRPAK